MKQNSCDEKMFNSRLSTLALILLLTSVFLFDIAKQYQPYTFANFDPGWQIATTQSIIEDGDLDIKNQLSANPLQVADQVAIGAHGEWYCVHENLLPILAMPFYLMFGINGCLCLNVILLVASLVIVYQICLCVTEPVFAFTAVLLVAFTSSIRGHAYSFSVDVLGVFMILIALCFLIHERYLWSGVFSGLSVLSRLANLPCVAVFVVWLLFRKSFRASFVNYMLGALPIACVFFLGNYFMFGNILHTGYSQNAYLVAGSLQIVSQQRLFFSSPLLAGILSILFDRANGIIVNTPMFILGVFGMFPLYKKSKDLFWLILLSSSALILFYSTYSGAVALGGGVRHFYFIVAMSAIPLATLFSSICPTQIKALPRPKLWNL